MFFDLQTCKIIINYSIFQNYDDKTITQKKRLQYFRFLLTFQKVRNSELQVFR
jgi:hypothetical protein